MADDRINSDELGTNRTTGSAIGTDWLTERDYWRNNYVSRPYTSVDRGFEYYEPGYRYGYESATRYRGRSWDELQNDLERGWNEFKDRGEAKWDDIKQAARDAWNRVTR